MQVLAGQAEAHKPCVLIQQRVSDQLFSGRPLGQVQLREAARQLHDAGPAGGCHRQVERCSGFRVQALRFGLTQVQIGNAWHHATEAQQRIERD